MSDAQEHTFETALERLQLTVKRLEGGELQLEDALQCFEEGVRLTQSCQKLLSAAETRIEQLIRVTSEGKAETQPFPSNR